MLVTANVVSSSQILVTLMMEAIRSFETSVVTTVQQPHGVKSQKKAFFRRRYMTTLCGNYIYLRIFASDYGTRNVRKIMALEM
jgi:hypothetical protein